MKLLLPNLKEIFEYCEHKFSRKSSNLFISVNGLILISIKIILFRLKESNFSFQKRAIC